MSTIFLNLSQLDKILNCGYQYFFNFSAYHCDNIFNKHIKFSLYSLI